ncbi:tetratricopeptide repeat protein [Glycocaulis abyssi]|uniref:Tetratricopeptide repeat protein n=1 Tax=Glycocaulis abyssi TaxID=1433403 RepID=A0ABV9NFM0_9PROT
MILPVKQKAVVLAAAACLAVFTLPAPNAAASGLGALSAAQQASIPPQDIAAIERHSAAGEAAFRSSDFRTATREFEAAFLIYHRHLGLNHPLSVVAGANMGMAMLGQGRFAEALEVLEVADEILAEIDPGNTRRPGIQRAIAMARDRQNPGAPAGAQPAPQQSPQTASPQPTSGSSVDALNNEAARAYQAGDYARAETGFLQVLAAHEEAGSGRSEGAGVAWVNLAEVYNQTRRHAEAENALARARAIFEAISPSHRYLAVVENNLTSVQRHQGGPEAVLAGYQSALERMRSTFSADHPNTAAAMGNLASAYLSLDRPAEARPLLEDALAIEIAAYGRGAPESADTVSGLGRAYLDLGRYEDAIRFQQDALDVLEQTANANPRHVATLRQRLGRALQMAGRAGDAEPVLRQALSESEAAFGPGTRQPVSAMSFLASALFDQGRYQEAESLQRRAIAEAQRLDNAERASVTGALESNLAGSLRMLGRLGDAETLYRASLDAAEREGQPLSIAMSLENLAGSIRAQGRLDEAAALQVRALDLYRETLGADHPEAVRAFANAGTTLGLAGDYEGAERLMRGGLDGLTGRIPETHTALLVARANLAWLFLRHMNRPAEALQLYRTASRSIVSAALDAAQAAGTDTAATALIVRRNDMFQLHTEAAWAAAHNEG